MPTHSPATTVYKDYPQRLVLRGSEVGALVRIANKATIVDPDGEMTALLDYLRNLDQGTQSHSVPVPLPLNEYPPM